MDCKTNCVMTQKRHAKEYDDRTYCKQCDGHIREGDCYKTNEYYLNPEGRCVNQFNLEPDVEYVRIDEYLKTHLPGHGTRLCLVCDKALQINDCDAPDDGTIWKSHGNWGSKVYDSMHGETFLVGYICDECLVKKKDRLFERHAWQEYKYEDKKAEL